MHQKSIKDIKRKKQPTSFDLKSLPISMSSLEFSVRKDRLEGFLSSSPYRTYTNTLTPPFAKSYSEFGLFGRGQAVRKEVNTLANNQKAHVVDHLKVMDEIKSRGPKI